MKRLHAIVILVARAVLVVFFRFYIWATTSPLVQKFKTSKKELLESDGEPPLAAQTSTIRHPQFK